MSYEGDDNILYYYEKDINWLNKWIRIKSEEEFKKYLEKHKYRKVTYKGTINDISEFKVLSDEIKVEAMGRYDGKEIQCGEIISKSCGKDKGIEKVIEILGIKRENTVAIGDSMNDYQMISYAGVGIAVENAEEKLKEIADMITDDCDRGGVGKALEKIF